MEQNKSCFSGISEALGARMPLIPQQVVEKGVGNGSSQIMLFMFPMCPNQQTQLEEARNLDAWELEVQDRNKGKPGCWRCILVFKCLFSVHEVLGPASSMTTIQ